MHLLAGRLIEQGARLQDDTTGVDVGERRQRLQEREGKRYREVEDVFKKRRG